MPHDVKTTKFSVDLQHRILKTSVKFFWHILLLLVYLTTLSINQAIQRSNEEVISEQSLWKELWKKLFVTKFMVQSGIYLIGTEETQENRPNSGARGRDLNPAPIETKL
jgi:hypothetical protein